MTIAVCMATYNGGKFIQGQITSILSELGSSDALLISDDGSTDDTMEKVLSIEDSRILIFQNARNLGYVRNFETVIARVVDAEYIFFSDQDDIWSPGRLQEMVACLKKSQKNILFGQFDVMGEGSLPNAVTTDQLPDNRLKSLCKLFLGLPQFPYYGSTMAISMVARSYLFPIPIPGISHDIWAALLGNFKGDIAYLPKIVTHRRLHGGNLTNPNRSLYDKIKTRGLWIAGLIIFLWRNC